MSKMLKPYDALCVSDLYLVAHPNLARLWNDCLRQQTVCSMADPFLESGFGLSVTHVLARSIGVGFVPYIYCTPT